MRMRAGGVIAAFLLFAALPAAPAGADKLTEENMTAKDYETITKTEESEAGKGIALPPAPVHDFNAADVKALKDAHAVKVIKGKDWKKMTPKERDKALRGAYGATLGRNSALFIEVPSGNVWAIPAEARAKLEGDRNFRPWTPEEKERLPKAVKRDPGTSHSDRSGTALERALTREEEP